MTSIDFGRVLAALHGRSPANRRRIAVGLLISALGWVAAFAILVPATRQLRMANAGQEPRGHDDLNRSSNLTDEVKKSIFFELAAAEPANRARSTANYPGEQWSADDDRGASERDTVRRIALAHNTSTAQIYLVLDQAIREHWPTKEGPPLAATTTPLHPRRKY
jgi:hypothetical protein